MHLADDPTQDAEGGEAGQANGAGVPTAISGSTREWLPDFADAAFWFLAGYE